MNQKQLRIQMFNRLGVLERQATRLKNAYMEKYGLKSLDGTLLLALYETEEGMRFDDFCRKLLVDKAQVSRSLKSLSTHGMVSSHSKGTYKATYNLTKQGEKLAEQLADEEEKILSHSSEYFADKDQQQFIEVCQMLINGFASRVSTEMPDDEEIAEMTAIEPEQN